MSLQCALLVCDCILSLYVQILIITVIHTFHDGIIVGIVSLHGDVRRLVAVRTLVLGIIPPPLPPGMEAVQRKVFAAPAAMLPGLLRRVPHGLASLVRMLLAADVVGLDLRIVRCPAPAAMDRPLGRHHVLGKYPGQGLQPLRRLGGLPDEGNDGGIAPFGQAVLDPLPLPGEVAILQPPLLLVIPGAPFCLRLGPGGGCLRLGL
mmetsp:Transcript_33334/g.98303  ORF Transcript_33334/g.98303 Transcript_33334/m.98303 type:complete len:205 (+) Transcript_33334:604-1218(+)